MNEGAPTPPKPAQPPVVPAEIDPLLADITRSGMEADQTAMRILQEQDKANETSMIEEKLGKEAAESFNSAIDLGGLYQSLVLLAEKETVRNNAKRAGAEPSRVFSTMKAQCEYIMDACNDKSPHLNYANGIAQLVNDLPRTPFGDLRPEHGFAKKVEELVRDLGVREGKIVDIIL